jgi:hypothetical protein
MQLLSITTTPMKIELEVEYAKLEYNQNFKPDYDISVKPAELELRTRGVELRLDTYEARKSLGCMNSADTTRQYAEKGKQHISRLTQEYVQDGKAMGEIQNGVEIRDIVRQKMLTQPELYTRFLPATGADITYQPGELNVNYQPGDMNLHWKVRDNLYNYVPGSVRMEIVEYPDIEIQYLGGPMYVPPSADPEFEGEAE